MRTWMLLWVATASLMLALPALADSQAIGDGAGLGLDFDDSEMGNGYVPEPDTERAEDAVLERDAERAAATAPVPPPTAEPVDIDALAAEAESLADAEASLDDTTTESSSDVTAEVDIDDSALLAADTESETNWAESDAAEDMPEAAAAAREIQLGPMGVDGDGRVGRVHTVSSGDTLWDISNAYLGTPWVWPSVWNDNDGISNPHHISPGDYIWITAGEMRIITDAQKDDLIAGVPEEVAMDETDWAPADEPPAALGDEDDLMAASEPTTMDELPVSVPADAPSAASTGAMVRVAEAESLGFVSPDSIDAASSIVDSSVPRLWLVDGDDIYVGLGEGDTQPGDEFTIYRDADAVRDLDGTLLGYHVEVLGWARVRSVDAEASTAEIRMSQSEIRRGDRVVPRDPVNINVPLTRSPDAVPGNIVYMPDSRTAMADGEWVYVNRGNLHGVEPGTELEVYDAGRFVRDKAKGDKVLTPDNVVAQLIVVDTQPDSAVAYIVHSRRALEVGDKVRPKVKTMAQR